MFLNNWKGVVSIDDKKEYLYIGHYIDTCGRYVLKIGTTKDLTRRTKEHTRAYHKSNNYTMANDEQFSVDWYIKLSKANTIRYEDKAKKKWKENHLGTYIRNDRFVFDTKPTSIVVTIKKDYVITL